MHEVLVNRLGGLSLPRKSVVRLTDRPNITLDVYRGRETTMQQQQQSIGPDCAAVHSCNSCLDLLHGKVVEVITNDFAIISFHIILFSAAPVVLPNSTPIHTLLLYSSLFLCLSLHFAFHCSQQYRLSQKSAKLPQFTFIDHL